MWEILAIIGALVAVGLVLAAMAGSTGVRVHARRPVSSARLRAAAAVQRQLMQTAGIRRQAARTMQVAIHQLAGSPDFRRAASFATRADRVGVPLDFRQRQFRRLRPLLIAHLVRLLREGSASDAAVKGLNELVTGLGAALYEADYIVTDARRQSAPAPEAAPDYRTLLRERHAEHVRRLEAIRQTDNLQDDIREQLLETEYERFRNQLLAEADER